MSKSAKKDPGDEPEIVTVCRNRRATHDYEISDAIECGIVLVGTEVKALRDGKANLEDAYARIDDDQVFLVGFEIPEYKMGNRQNHEPKRTRKLLLHRREIAKFAGKADDRGFTLVPLRVYFKNGRAKVEIAVGKGKQNYDKRQSLKKAEAKREMDRATASRRRK
jgi:SsrA-binding protein